MSLRLVEWSPDGKFIIFITEDAEAFLYSSDGSRIRRLILPAQEVRICRCRLCLFCFLYPLAPLTCMDVGAHPLKYRPTPPTADATTTSMTPPYHSRTRCTYNQGNNGGEGGVHVAGFDWYDNTGPPTRSHGNVEAAPNCVVAFTDGMVQVRETEYI